MASIYGFSVERRRGWSRRRVWSRRRRRTARRTERGGDGFARARACSDAAAAFARSISASSVSLSLSPREKRRTNRESEERGVWVAYEGEGALPGVGSQGERHGCDGGWIRKTKVRRCDGGVEDL